MIDLGCTVQFKVPFSSIFGVGSSAFRATEESEAPRAHKPPSEEDLLWLSNIWLHWNVWSWKTEEEKRSIKGNFPCETCKFTQSCNHWNKLFQHLHENSHFKPTLVLDEVLRVLLPGNCIIMRFVLFWFFKYVPLKWELKHLEVRIWSFGGKGGGL